MTKIAFDNLFSHNCVTSSRKQNIHREEAQSLVELALLTPLFILLLLGSAEFARFGWAAVLTSNAARAGAAYGSQNAVTAIDTAGIQSVAASDSVNLTGLATTSSVSCVCSNGTAIPDCTKALTYCPASSGTILDYVQVSTSSTVSPLVHYPGLPIRLTVTGKSIMVIEQ
jgi:Flp pilus assembly protein TadG